MGKRSAAREQSRFGAWLEAEIAAQGMKPREFAMQIGVSPSTVSRWMGMRLPEARYYEPIAEALFLSTEDVMARAGLLPTDGIEHPDGDRAKIVGMARRVRLDRLRSKLLRRVLETMIEEDQERRRTTEAAQKAE